MSTIAGLHVPVTPLVEVLLRTGTISFEQIVRNKPKLNTGVTFGLMVTVNVVGIAQNPASGVKI